MTKAPPPPAPDGQLVLLSGGNPQIPKGYGDQPVRDWIAAAPGWKSQAAQAIDDAVVRVVPGVKKAVKWNSPLYGLDGSTWFLSFHAMSRYIKVAFHKGAQLDPPPPVASRQKDMRYFHLAEGETLDRDRFEDWVKQASRLPGDKM